MIISHQLDRPKARGADWNHNMSVAFLECDAFREFYPEGFKCCESCHSDKAHRIFVRPIRDEVGNPDWLLCIEGIVCCRSYDYVRQIPHEWWERESKRLGVKRDDGRGHVYSQALEGDAEKPTVRPPKVRVINKTVAAAKRKAFLHREEPSLDDFLRRRR